MKVLVKRVTIENQDFVLIEDTDTQYGRFYGTIPYTELDEEGRMKRPLNGFEMCVSKKSRGDCVCRRAESIVSKRLMKLYKEQGYDELTALQMVIENDEYKKIRAV